MSIEQGLQQQKEFLEFWPINKLENLTLDEYTNLNKEDAFIYWLERRTEMTGSIWGGSAYKFGIYRKRNTEKENTQENVKTDGKYAWYTKYGNTAEEAFESIKSIIVRVANNSIHQRFDQIDSEDLGSAIKWKIAFLYNSANLLPIFKRDWLEKAAENYGLEDSKRKTISELQSFLISQKPLESNTLKFAETIWTKFNSDQFFFVIEKFLKQAGTENLKKQGYPKNYRDYEIKLSFGAGSTAKIPWIALIKLPNTVSNGIYPVYLFYKEVNRLILAYGISETSNASHSWDKLELKTTIENWHINEFGSAPHRYGTSYIKSIYDLNEELSSDKIQTDLDDILKEYSKINFQAQQTKNLDPTFQTPNYWLIAPGEGANKWDDFYSNGIIGLGWSEIDNLEIYPDRDLLTQS